MTGRVFDIREMTVHDGDGVRITVFMKGCPLRCRWCHNPEGLSFEKQLLYKKNRCTKCGECMKECDHEECKPYGRCIYACPNDCLSIAGTDITEFELAKKINSHKRLFDIMGGGVTFSGGEPLSQWEFISKVMDNLDHINTSVETSGYVNEEIFKEAVNKLDFIIMDIKVADREKHKEYTGVYNDIILRNFEYLKNSGKNYLIRTPIIKGYTDGDDNLKRIREIIGNSCWEKIPENYLAKAKIEMLKIE